MQRVSVKMCTDSIIKKLLDPISNIKKLNEIVEKLYIEMKEALNSSEKSMLTYPDIYPSGIESGIYFSIDLGGSTLRVSIVQVSQKTSSPIVLMEKTEGVSENLKCQGTKEFLSFITNVVYDVYIKALAENYIEARTTIPVGVTWSFPVLTGSDVSSGLIVTMGKGYKRISSELAGQDLKILLDASFNEYPKLSLPLEVKAIVNDSVAIHISSSYKIQKLLNSFREENPIAEIDYDGNSVIGFVLGTGTNACMRLPISLFDSMNNPKLNKKDLNVTKYKLDSKNLQEYNNINVSRNDNFNGNANVNFKEKNNFLLINTELGMFGGDIFPRTKWDNIINNANEIPGLQPLEMMVSGRYLGEISRLIIFDLINEGKIFNDNEFTIPKLLCEPYGLKTATMSKIENCENFSEKCDIFANDLGIESYVSENDIKIIGEVFYAVSHRASAYVACAIVALSKFLSGDNAKNSVTWNKNNKERTSNLASLPNYTKEIKVAYIGSLFVNYTSYRESCKDYLKLLSPDRRINVEYAMNSSITGAALAAATNATRMCRL